MTKNDSQSARQISTLADLTPDPQNARAHNERNVQMIEDALHEVGAARSIVIDEDGVILAGNATIEAAAQAGIERVRVVDADGEEIIAVRRSGLTPQQKKRLALYDNRTAELAGWEADILAQLAADDAQAADPDDRVLAGLFTDAELQVELAALVNTDEVQGGGFTAVDEELSGAFMLKPDMRFESSEPFEIPPLRDDRLLDFDTLQLWPGDDLRHIPNDTDPLLLIYSCSCQALDFTRSVMAFYTEDARFEHLWTRPDNFASKIINAGLLGSIAPNYSLWPKSPQVVRMWNIYRSRWVARYFQEAGINIIPDVNWSGRGDYDFCFAGIPKHAPLLALQMQNFKPSDALQVEAVKDGILTAIERLRPERLLIYGSKAGRALFEGLEVQTPAIILPTLMDYRREKLKSKPL